MSGDLLVNCPPKYAPSYLANWFKLRPPGYWRDGKYRFILVIRNDGYVMDEEGRKIHLKDYYLTLSFRGLG